MSRYHIREKLTSRLRQPWFGGGVGALLAAAIGLALLYSPDDINTRLNLDVGKGLRDWSYDLLYFPLPAFQNQDVRIIYLDEKSYNQLGQNPAEFDHELHARLVRKLKAEGAKLIVFDLDFIDSKSSSEAADKDFAQAMREDGKVILGAQEDYLEHMPARAMRIIPPIDPLRDACAGWGLARLQNDTDSVPRRHHPGREQVPSLAWKSAEIFGAEVTKDPASRGQRRWLNYYAEHPFKGVSYSDALDGSYPAGFFKDKVVFIGAGNDVSGYSTGEQKDNFRSPWSWLPSGNEGGIVAEAHYHLGVEVHAITFTNLVQRDWLVRLPIWMEMVIVFSMGVLLGYGLTLFRPFAATGIACAFDIALIVASFVAFAKFKIWSPWLIPVAVQAPIALAWSYLFYSVKSFVETKLLETSLALYLSPHLVKEILKQPDLLKPGGQEKTVTILFSDIASFSKISEGMDPNKLVNELNYYYEEAIGCVHQTDGTVMNLIGDAIFAIWNAPLEQPNHQELACRAALALSEHVNHPDAASGHLPFRTRIGVHTGVACVGNIGGSAHFNFTAIGESVNMASRLEGLNKQLGTNILLTSDVQKTLAGKLNTRLVGHFRFKGFDKVTPVYELVSVAQPAEATPPWQLSFDQAMGNFQRKLFTEAAQGFHETLRLRPEDGPAKYYLARIVELQIQNLPKEWMGEIYLVEK